MNDTDVMLARMAKALRHSVRALDPLGGASYDCERARTLGSAVLAAYDAHLRARAEEEAETRRRFEEAKDGE